MVRLSLYKDFVIYFYEISLCFSENKKTISLTDPIYSCHSLLPFIALCFTAIYLLLMPFICPILPFTILDLSFYCSLLPFIALYLPFIALYCLELPLTALCCPLLPFPALY